MKEFLEVFKYTFNENIKKKAFIISTIVILIIVLAAIIIPSLIMNSGKDQGAQGQGAQGENSGEKEVLYFIDNSGYYKDSIAGIEQSLKEYSIKIESADNIEKLKNDIKENGNSSLLIINDKDGLPVFDYFVKQYGDGPDPSTLTDILKKQFTKDLLTKENVSDSVSSKVLTDFGINTNELGKNKWGGYFASIVIVIALFFAIYFYGYSVSMSVASEKTSRVMEVLVTSVKPSRIILGKVAGTGCLGLLQLTLILATGIGAFKVFFPSNLSLGGMSIDFSSFSPLVIVLMIVYFVLGYFLYAMMYAVVGATVSKAEDVNSAMMPLSLVSIIAFYFAYGTFAIPDSVPAKAASLIPFTASFSMPARLVSTDIAAWEIIASIGILAITLVIVSMVSIKLYSLAILHYGNRLKLSKLFKLSKSN